MKDRIREIRKDNGLTQKEFGDRIGLVQNAIAKYEKGLRTPATAIVRAICREFRVSQLWLETGVEPKYIDQDEEDIEVINRIMEGQSKNKKELVRLIANMPDELFDSVYDYFVNRKL